MDTIILAVGAGLLTTTQAVLGALFTHPQLRRLSTNTLMAQKRFTDAHQVGPDEMRMWIVESHPEQLCRWYWEYDYIDVDTLDLVLDVHFELV